MMDSFLDGFRGDFRRVPALFYLQRYLDGLRIRSSRSISHSSRVVRRLCLTAVAMDWGSSQNCRMKRRIARGSGFILLMTRTVRMEPEMPGSSSLAPAGGDSQFNRWRGNG